MCPRRLDLAADAPCAGGLPAQHRGAARHPPQELGALAYLRDHAEASQQALTQALQLDANSCVLLLNELEAAGFAERRRDADDRRRHSSCSRPRAGGARAGRARAQASIEDEVLAILGPEERAPLRAARRPPRRLAAPAEVRVRQRPGFRLES